MYIFFYFTIFCKCYRSTSKREIINTLGRGNKALCRRQILSWSWNKNRMLAGSSKGSRQQLRCQSGKHGRIEHRPVMSWEMRFKRTSRPHGERVIRAVKYEHGSTGKGITGSKVIFLLKQALNLSSPLSLVWHASPQGFTYCLLSKDTHQLCVCVCVGGGGV